MPSNDTTGLERLEKLLPRCPTKDTDDFPEIKEHLDDDPKAGCYNCRLWEAIDTHTQAEVERARIDELEMLQILHTRTYHQKVTDREGNVYTDDTRSFISAYELQERIATLKRKDSDSDIECNILNGVCISNQYPLHKCERKKGE